MKNEATIEENSHGVHPVNLAVKMNTVEVLQLLLDYGAKIQMNTDGEHPLNVAVRNKMKIWRKFF